MVTKSLSSELLGTLLEAQSLEEEKGDAAREPLRLWACDGDMAWDMA